jgi:hypothetical protein
LNSSSIERLEEFYLAPDGGELPEKHLQVNRDGANVNLSKVMGYIMKTTLFMLLAVGTFLLNPPQNANADILDHWTTNQLTFDYQYMTAIAYGSGHWVATAGFEDGVEYFYSTNGSNWVEADFFTGAWGSTLKCENGHFISVGGYGTISYSTNGVDWNAYYIPGPFIGDGRGFGDVSYGNGMFVSVGMTNPTSFETGTGYILSSPDGTNWTSQLSQLLTRGYLSSVTYGASRFVAVGDNDGNLYYSANGTTWQRTLIAGGNSVTFCNGLFIIPLTAGTNLISVNGANWSQQPTGLTNWVGQISFSHGLFMGYAAGYLATSIDGTNWFQYPNRFDSGPFTTDGSRVATISSVYTGLGFFKGYDGYVNLSDPLVDLRLTNNTPRSVVLSGLVGRNYQILSSDILGSGAHWSTDFSVQLTNTPFIWTDPTATNRTRFYRAALLQ